jgi:hypothetical protein
MGLGTKNLKGEGSSLPKVIEPGVNHVKVNSVTLEEFTFLPGSYHVILNVETGPIDGFEGFFIDKDNPAKGRYTGQIGKVKMSQYAYNDGTTKSGVEVYRDDEILKSLKRLSVELGILQKFEDMDGKYDTIEEFVKAYNKAIPKDIYLNMCVCGKEYENKQGYKSYDLFLPKSSKTEVAIENAGVSESKLIRFNAEKHIIKKQPQTLSEFGQPADLNPFEEKTSTGFEL